MRSTLPFLAAFVAILGCKGDLTTPVSNKSPEPAKPIFAVGSAEQTLVDQFLSHFPPEQARKLEEALRTGSSTVVAENPAWQKELDGIYAGLDRKPLAARSAALQVAASQYKPGPAEAALIEDFMASASKNVSPELAAKLRQSLLNPSAQLTSSNPVMLNKIHKIYEARRKAMELEDEQNQRQ